MASVSKSLTGSATDVIAMERIADDHECRMRHTVEVLKAVFSIQD